MYNKLNKYKIFLINLRKWNFIKLNYNNLKIV